MRSGKVIIILSFNLAGNGCLTATVFAQGLTQLKNNVGKEVQTSLPNSMQSGLLY